MRPIPDRLTPLECSPVQKTRQETENGAKLFRAFPGVTESTIWCLQNKLSTAYPTGGHVTLLEHHRVDDMFYKRRGLFDKVAEVLSTASLL